MSNRLDTTSTVTLVINGEQSKTSLRDITTALNAVRAARARMNQEEDPERYEELIRQEQALAAAQRERRKETDAGTEAQKGFFADFKKGFSEISEMAGQITAGTLIYKGVNSIIEGIKGVIEGSEEAFNESAKSQAQLEAALRSTQGIAGQTKQALNDLAKAEMDKTAIDDDVINKSEEMLLTFTNVRGKIYEQSIPAIIDMTSAMNQGNVTMETVQQTSILVGKALNDPINGMTALRKVGVTLDDSQRTLIKTLVETNRLQDAQAIILKELTKEFGGNAKAVADSEAGPMQKFQTRIGNIQEAIGGWIVAGKSLAVDVLNPFLSWVERMVDTPLSETLHEDQKALLGMRVELESTNTTNEHRIALINELKEKYPGYLNQVDADTAKNKDLLPILEKINQAFVLRIAYQTRAEKLDKAIKDEADAINDTYDQRQKLIMRIAEIQQTLSEDGIKFTAKGNTEEEKAIYIRKNLINTIRDQAQSNKDLNNVLASNKYENLISGLNSYGNSLYSSTLKQKESHESVKQITEDLTAFKKASGYNDTIVPADLMKNLSDKVKVLKTVLDDTKKGSADYEKMTSVLAKANAELKQGVNDKEAAINVPKIISEIDPLIAPKSGKSAQQIKAEQDAAERRRKGIEDAEAQSKAFTQKIIEFNAQVFSDTLSKNDKEIQDTKNKFNTLIATQQAALDKLKSNKYADANEIKKHEDELSQLTLSRDSAVAQIKVRQAKDVEDKINQLRDRAGVNLKNDYQKEVDTINEKFDQLSKDAGDNQDAQNRIYYERVAALGDARIRLEKQLQKEIQRIKDEGATTDDDKKAAEIAKLNQQYDKELDDLKNKYAGELEATQEYQDAKNAILSNKKKAIDNVNGGDDDKKAKEKAKEQKQFAIDAAQNVANSVFEIQKNRRQAETDAELANLDRKRDAELNNENLTAAQRSAIQDKYAKQEAEIKRKAWEADKQAALSQAIINGALAVVKALPNFYLAAAAGVAAAAQIITISSEKAPEFGYGGIIDGPSHANGGVDMIDTQTGRKIANVEGGEPLMVLSKDTYANNRMLINELLYNSQYRNGAPVSVNTRLSTMPATGIYRDGGIIDHSQGAVTGTTKNNVMLNDNSELIAEIRLMRQAVQDQEVIFNDRLYEQFKAKKISIRNRANAA